MPPITDPPMPGAPNPPSPSQAGSGWQFPDYNQLLTQWFNPYLTQYNSAQQQALAWLNSQSQIAQNRFNQGDTSTMARLKDIHDIALRDITNGLAARGILNSGETKYQNQQENLRYKRASYDASNQLLDYLSGLQQQYALNQQSSYGNLLNTETGLAGTLAQIYQPYYTPPGTTP